MCRWAAVGALVLAGGLIAATPGSSLRSASGRQSALHVIPFPGTPDVTPHSPIIFSSLRPSALSSVLVMGSRSGRHDGRLVGLPDGAGTAFEPSRAFLAGELVHVRAALRSPADGTASGDPDGRVLRFSFQVSRPTPPARRTGAGGHSARSAFGPSQSFRSEPNIHPPLVIFSGHLPGTGDVFVTAQNERQSAPMIINPKGQLVWYLPISSGEPMNLQVQHYQGEPVLTYWVGIFRNWGADYILNTRYQRVAVIHGADGLAADLHDFRITQQGTALIDAYQETKANLTSVGGPRKGHVLDCVIQELDIKTGRLLWEWHALGHIPLSDSESPAPTGSHPFDYFHLNSIQQLPNGNILISARNTWAVYEIDRATGKILWEIGGKHSSFRMGHGTRFEWQHNARLRGQTLSLFDDGAAPQEESQSSGKLLRIDWKARTVSLMHRYAHRPSLLANSAGSTQVLADGDVFVGWGPNPDFSEYTHNGRQIFSGAFAWGTASYRAFRFHWTATPATPPVIALNPTPDGGVTLYASWNGATRVRKWQVLEGLLPDELTAAGLPYRRTGFETAINLDGRPPYIAVQAMAASGLVLGTSKTVSDPVLGSG